MQELSSPPLGGVGKVVEIDETFVGGKKRRKGVKAGKNAKIAVLGIAERSGRVHLQRISNVQAESIKPVLDARLNLDAGKIGSQLRPLFRGLAGTRRETRKGES